MIIYIDIDDTLADYSSAIEAKKDEIDYPQSEYRFFATLNPLKGALTAVKELSEEAEVYFLTAPSTKNLLSYTEKAEWVRTWFGEEALDRLIISPDKSLLKGDILIDNTKWKFDGEFILFGSEKFPDWLSVLEHVLWQYS